MKHRFLLLGSKVDLLLLLSSCWSKLVVKVSPPQLVIGSIRTFAKEITELNICFKDSKKEPFKLEHLYPEISLSIFKKKARGISLLKTSYTFDKNPFVF